MHCCARSRFINFAQLIWSRPSELSILCYLATFTRTCSPLFVLAGLRLCETGYGWEFALYYCLLLLFILPVCNAETVNANHQAELINSSLLGVSCILQDCLLAFSVCTTSIAIFLAFCALLAICRFPSPFQGIGTASTYYAPKIFPWGLVVPSSPFQVTEISRATPCSYVTFLLYPA
jgi:hypothetical protein